MSWGVLPWVYPFWNSLGFLDFGDYFLPHFREVFNYYLLRYFLMAFLFVFFFRDSSDSNVGVFNIVSDVSEIVFISFFLSASLFPPFYLPPHLYYLLSQKIGYLIISYRYLSYLYTAIYRYISYSNVGSLQSAFDLSYCIIHY